MIFYRRWHRPLVLSFDLDDTLYDNTKTINYAEAYSRTLLGVTMLCGRKITDKEYSQTRDNILSILPEAQYDVSLLRYFIYRKLLIQAGWGKYKAAEEAKRQVDAFIKVRARIPLEEKNVAIIKELANYYPVYAVSNGNADISKTSLKGIFTDVLYPDVNLPGKPEPDIFIKIAALSGVPISSLCHIGDRGETDVCGAINAGALSIWCTSFRREANELRVLPHVESSLDELKSILL